jgi:hypothetical protein
MEKLSISKEMLIHNVKAILICFSYSKCITNPLFRNNHTYWLLVFISPWQNICQKIPELQSSKWTLHHDNALSHITFVKSHLWPKNYNFWNSHCNHLIQPYHFVMITWIKTLKTQL